MGPWNLSICVAIERLTFLNSVSVCADVMCYDGALIVGAPERHMPSHAIHVLLMFLSP